MAADRSDPPSSSSSPRRRRGRTLLAVVAVIAVVALALVIGGRWWIQSRVEASLPTLDGEIAVAGLGAPVTLERDDLGVVTVTGEDRIDVARGLGFAHGQDRFFQMDLLRRGAAGTLAELLGPVVVAQDRALRRHRFLALADRVVESLSDDERALLEAYAEGVRAGLASLDAAPFEYLVLRTEPADWQPRDTVLVLYAMYLDLQEGDGVTETSLGLLEEVAGADVAAFLAPPGTPWDAPLIGDASPLPPLPGGEAISAEDADESGDAAESESAAEPAPAPGSNNWAVAGNRSADGRAILANDPHLGLSVPHIWYRASLVWNDGAGGRHRVTGITLPGVPFVIIGSNGSIAWGFTNSYIDTSDVVLVEEIDADTYRTADGPRAYTVHEEEIRISGGEPVTETVTWTVWGPLLDDDPLGRRRALRWIAHDVEGADLGLAALETATGVDEALAVAHRAGLPNQNFVVAGDDGRIAWTIIGPVPRRVGHDGRTPTSWADGSRGWDGWLAPEEVPVVMAPESGVLWTANNRVAGGEALALVGDGGYALGARAHQIRHRLEALDGATEEDLFEIQLDDEALFLVPWRTLILDALAAAPGAVDGDPLLAEARALVESWGGRAAVEGSAGYRLVRQTRLELSSRTLAPLAAAVQEVDRDYRFWRATNQMEAALWRLLGETPAVDGVRELLPEVDGLEADASVEEHRAAVVREALGAVARRLSARPGGLAERTWGETNRLAMNHPLSRALPGPVAGLLPELDMAPVALSGDRDMPRVQFPSFGASARLVVSPGAEEDGIFHMPGGQSGHPLSPWYRGGHEAWVEGRPTPFLPGPAAHTLTLAPAGE